MTRLERIERNISQLSQGELEEFRAWFAAFDAANWNGEIEEDAALGVLDGLADRALAEHHAGHSKPV